MEFHLGYDLDLFKKYYRTLHDLHQFYNSHNLTESRSMELGADELNHIKRNPQHLIIWMQDQEIIGHTVWHETSTDEMVPGDPRSKEDKQVLRQLFEGNKENLVELHEVWLKTEHRGKGYGNRFFEFFERFAIKSGFDGIVYYSDNPSAISLCRKRGYKESLEPLEGAVWNIFVKLL